MLVQLKNGRDGRPTLVCVRPDGSRTWSKIHPGFPLHDLTHYAVESVLGFAQAFFGLIASGWSIEAFAERGAPARMPEEALWAEHVVGIFDLERGMSRSLSVEEFNEALEQSFVGKPTRPFRPLTHVELAAIRSLRSALAARWWAVAPGKTLELHFPAPTSDQPQPTRSSGPT